MKFIKNIFAFFFSKKFATFLVALFLVIGLAIAWQPFFELFDRYEEYFLGFWWLAQLITIITLYVTTPSWKLGFGRSLIFAAGIGALGSIIMMMLEGPGDAIAPVIFTAVAFAGSYPLLNHVVQSDPHALDKLSAESKHLKDFSAFYQRELQDWMHTQEERREKAVRQQWIGLCFAIPASMLVTGLIDYFIIPDVVSEDGSIWDWVVFFVWAIAMIITCGLACTPAWELKEEMKTQLLGKLSGYFGDLTHHKKLENFNADKFKDVGLIKRYNKKDVDDGFTGKHDHVSFILTEIDLKHVTGHGKNRHTEFVFDGLMVVMSFPMPFKGRTLVLKDKGKVGNWLKDKGTDLERVNLNIKQFEDKFEVYSTDQIEARAILTPDLMENLIKLGALMDETDELGATTNNVEMAFDNRVLMITIATSKDLFELGHLDASMEDTARIAKFAREVGLIYEIIDIMELNRKAETFSALKGEVLSNE